MVRLAGPDSADSPFGAMVHLDLIEIKRDTQAYRVAQRALIITDEFTKFLGGFPSNRKTREVVVEAIHRFDDVPPAIRRWWTDRIRNR